jgi:hypothetical protein
MDLEYPNSERMSNQVRNLTDKRESPFTAVPPVHEAEASRYVCVVIPSIAVVRSFRVVLPAHEAKASHYRLQMSSTSNEPE